MGAMNEKAEFENPRRSRLAVVSLLLGMLSILLPILVARIFHPLVLVELLSADLILLAPFAALVIGILSLYRIGKSKELLKGKVCAGVGIFLSALPLILSSLLIISGVSMYAKSEVATINDVTKETTLLLSNKERQKNADGFHIYISGNLEGSAPISIEENENNKHEYMVSNGKVRLAFDGTWYNNECLITYKPTTVNSGHLKIRYYFDTF